MNNWLKNDKNQIDDYINNSQIYLIERKRCLKILVDLFDYHFKEPNNLAVLDLGCGDGTLTKLLSGIYPENNYYLLDGSKAMLEKAKNLLQDRSCSFIEQTFDDFIETPTEDMKYDFVFSSNAIHHLDICGKTRLYNTIFHQLKHNGMFINVDVVKPNTQKSEEFQFLMWTDWIKEYIEKNSLGDMNGKFDNTPQIHKSKAENKPSTLFTQLDQLSRAGFRDVDCYYKYSVFAVFGGIK